MLKRIYELFVGFRYLKSKKTQGFISFNTFLSVFIVFIGVFILVLVISVMNGFQSQIKDRIIDVDAHITVGKDFSSEPSGAFRRYEEIVTAIRAQKGITNVTPYYQNHGILRARGEMKPVAVRGMGAIEAMPDQFSRFIVEGPKTFVKKGEIYIGRELATVYNILIGDTVELIVPRGRLGSESLEPGMGRYRVAGFFKTGYYEFDTTLLVISLDDAQRLFAAPGRATAIAVGITDIYRMNRFATQLRSLLGYAYTVNTAEERNQNLFYALKLEKLIMTIILFLIIVSAGFTIMGTMVMVVMEKRRAVGILKSMGATSHSIMTIFVLEGFLIGLTGTLAGVTAGLAAALNLKAIIDSVERLINAIGAYLYEVLKLGTYFDISLVPQNVYYIEGIPCQIKPEFVTFIAAFAIFLATLSAIFPAWYASRLNPIETIRYE